MEVAAPRIRDANRGRRVALGPGTDGPSGGCCFVRQQQ